MTEPSKDKWAGEVKADLYVGAGRDLDSRAQARGRVAGRGSHDLTFCGFKSGAVSAVQAPRSRDGGAKRLLRRVFQVFGEY